MNAKAGIVATFVAVLLTACGYSPQNLIVGKWEADAAIKMTAEFASDGTARITMLGQTVPAKYRLNGENELEWIINGISTKAKVNVTATDLELTDDQNRTIKYKRK